MPRQQRVSLPLDELTDRQLHLYHIRLLKEQTAILKSLEKNMADLAQSVADLQAAVDGVTARVAGQVQSLTDALAAANQALADEALDDAGREQALSEALAAADAAGAAIQSQVEELNAIGAQPEVPVEPEPIPEDQPHVDNTLPGDLPPDEAPAEETPA